MYTRKCAFWLQGEKDFVLLVSIHMYKECANKSNPLENISVWLTSATATEDSAILLHFILTYWSTTYATNLFKTSRVVRCLIDQC